jgi:hypothetical protein
VQVNFIFIYLFIYLFLFSTLLLSKLSINNALSSSLTPSLYVISWYQRAPGKCQKLMESALPGSALSRVLMLLELLTSDHTIRSELREEFKEREVVKKTLKYGRRVEDEERESRSKVDVFQSSGTGQLKKPPRNADQGDDQLLGAAASALHETWRMEVPKKPVWKQIGEVEYQQWFDCRFHEQLVRSPLGQRLVNVNAPHFLLPPSLREEGLAVAASCLEAIRVLGASSTHYHIDAIAKAVKIEIPFFFFFFFWYLCMYLSISLFFFLLFFFFFM